MSELSTADTIFEKVISFIDYTNQNIFLTGKAGTGKTTFLKKIKGQSTKKIIVVAPTGVAAMNAKGTTINSFFQLPPGSFFPGDISLQTLQSGIVSIQSLVAELSYSREKLTLLNELELLVIDEVSMVRCDLLDVIDAILRSVRKSYSPFGGVQLLLIGDLYQLPPVTKREEWSFLNSVYPSPYFFDALVIRRNPLLQVELTDVFRQTEPEFINILNDIRNNQISNESLTLLNKRHQPDFTPTEDLNPIIITSHNIEANLINKRKLDELAGMEYAFEGEISGEFRDLGLQAEQSLKLKEGAQVMFIKNDTGDDRKFYNGKIGKVKSIRNTEIWISFPQEKDLLLEKSLWQSFEYKIDTEESIVQQQVGEFSQYPIKLAWAVTIHKSQGLTFDHAIIDAGKSFVAGQVYVALSRVRTLNGLILQSKITTESLRSNIEVINYMKPSSIEDMDDLLVISKEKYILDLVLSHFSLYSLQTGLMTITSNAEIQKANIAEFKLLLIQLEKSVSDLNAVGTKFQSQVKLLHQQSGFAEQQALQSRIISALCYFTKEITLQLLNPLNKNIRVKPKNKIQQQIQHMLLKYRQIIEYKISIMQYASSLLEKPVDKEFYSQWIAEQKEKTKRKPSTSNSAQQNISLQLF
ncbi:ATP-dependent RecD-like DNA helicase [Pedobacter sp. JCM 36344]|uniref:ATP-dependent DNA helicase n=1 Tax=Pedobacter sp. JCM 36344 TaxID=3374280 RepID=UPI0039794543